LNLSRARKELDVIIIKLLGVLCVAASLVLPFYVERFRSRDTIDREEAWLAYMFLGGVLFVGILCLFPHEVTRLIFELVRDMFQLLEKLLSPKF
jgi:hypothetical protein